ncbi:MAG: dethiobiotin synthase [Bryobacterales bacterium]|nr:dethiobiotin synthase [Bryobacterales bacterium]MDE0622954.1 dethiobiotin synthase [Bryobacterales bacterium]
MMRGVFVTGTDTGVGKTVVSALLVSALRRSAKVGYWKPVQTGIEEDDDTAEVRRLAACDPAEIADVGVRLPRPLSPHLSARLAGQTIEMADLLRTAKGLPDDRYWIVEGAGGLLVPLNESAMMADLIRALSLPVVIAARSGLGTINHTSLTVSELARRSIDVAGVVMVGEPNAENRLAIERYGGARVLAEVPVLSNLSASAVAAIAADAAPALASLL